MSEAVAISSREVLDLLTDLVDASLVVYEEQADGAGRYRLLETTRQYAASLSPLDEAASVERRHAEYFLAFALEAEQHSYTSDQRTWYDRLQTEHDNLRAVLDWAGRAEEHEIALRMATLLCRFWYKRGHLAESRRRMEEVLAQGRAASPELRARALNAAGSV